MTSSAPAWPSAPPSMSAMAALRLGDACRDDDALAGRKPIGLDDDRRALGPHIGLRRRRVGEAAEARRRDAGLGAELLGERLRAFELGRGAARPERLDARRREIVDDAGDERRLRPDDDEIDPFGPGSRRDRGVIGDVERQIRAALRRAGVAGRDEQALAERARGELPGQRMLAPARADQKYPHDEAPIATPVGLWTHAGAGRKRNDRL